MIERVSKYKLWFSPSNETFNWGPLALLLRLQYKFPFGINKVQFSFFYELWFVIQVRINIDFLRNHWIISWRLSHFLRSTYFEMYWCCLFLNLINCIPSCLLLPCGEKIVTKREIAKAYLLSKFANILFPVETIKMKESNPFTIKR